MTVVQYIRESGVGTTAEIMGMARVDKAGFEYLKKCAIEQAANLGVVLELGPTS